MLSGSIMNIYVDGPLIVLKGISSSVQRIC